MKEFFNSTDDEDDQEIEERIEDEETLSAAIALEVSIFYILESF